MPSLGCKGHAARSIRAGPFHHPGDHVAAVAASLALDERSAKGNEAAARRDSPMSSRGNGRLKTYRPAGRATFGTAG